MKLKLLVLSLACTSNLLAQENHADEHNISVYENYRDIPVSKRIDRAATKDRVNQYFPQWYVFSDKLNGQFTDIFGKAQSIPGSTLSQKLDDCFNSKLANLGVDKNEWIQTQNVDASFAKFVNYKQVINSHEVVFSRLGFRFTKDNRLERIQMKNFGKPANISPSITKEAAKVISREGVKNATIINNVVEDNWYWFPVPKVDGYELRPVWAFSLYGKDEHSILELNGYIDGITGEILYQSNDVKEIVDLTVKGVVYKQNPQLPASTESLPHLLVTIGSNQFYTDTAGYFSDANLSTPINATVSLKGRWSDVKDQLNGAATPSYVTQINGTGTTITYDTVAPLNDRLVNAYYHVNRVHDFMKGFFPSFTGMDYALTTNVDNQGGTCNAFYSGGSNSINFYAASPGCNSFAYAGDIIYHEYGHAINHRFYQASGANSMRNGALNEGHADVWGIGISKDPVLGKGAFSNGGVIRRYDQAPKVYPYDIVSEVHADGEIIAGAWWDVAQNINSVDTMSQIFTKSYFGLSDGPNGTEGDVFHSVLIEALLGDDNDNNIANGTPHFTQIVSAFARHGIYLLTDAEITHTEVPHQPVNTPITINASISVTEPIFLKDLVVFYKERASSTWDSVVMTNTSGTNYTATLPGFAEGTIYDYYFAVYDNTGLVNAYAPINYIPTRNFTQNNIPFQFGVGIAKVSGTDFESTLDPAWQIGVTTDNATTSGRWIVAKPIPSTASSMPVQTGVDHTTSTNQGTCLVTGNATSPSSNAGTADVDDGTTTAVTPIYDLTAFENPIIEYYRWYVNDKGSNRGSDNWDVRIKLDVSGTWSPSVIERTNKSDNSWRRRIFKVRDILNTTSPLKIQIGFVAADRVVTSQSNDGESTVEAAVDDIFIYDNVSSPTSTQDIQNIKAKIFPNPANDEITITLYQNASGSISLHDLTGKEILRKEMTGNKISYTITTASVANGTYMLMINTGKTIQTSKVSIIH